MVAIILTDGSMAGIQLILNFIYGRLNKRDEVIMEILTVLFMQMEWS